MLVACWLAVVKAGGIAVPTMPLLRARELAQICSRLEVALALCDDRFVDELDAVCAGEGDAQGNRAKHAFS
jgi:2-aminobenzoate-CoA ligase